MCPTGDAMGLPAVPALRFRRACSLHSSFIQDDRVDLPIHRDRTSLTSCSTVSPRRAVISNGATGSQPGKLGILTT